MDTNNIIPAAKAREEDMIFFSFLNLTKMGIVPNNVDIPAKKVNINAYFTISPNKVYLFISKITFFSNYKFKIIVQNKGVV